MLQIKHLMDAVESTDGQRIWVEPIGLTLDLREWCKVDHLLAHLGPPEKIWRWFQNHPDGYDFFRAAYHQSLSDSPHRGTIVDLISAARKANFTLVHQGEDPQHNTAIALYEFLSEYDAYVPPEA